MQTTTRSARIGVAITGLAILLATCWVLFLAALLPAYAAKTTAVARKPMPTTILKGESLRPLSMYMVAKAHSQPASGSAKNSAVLAAKLVKKARALLNLPYKFGGTDFRKALDCSAYVQFVFRQVGIHLPRSTFQQIKVGQAVSYAQLRPGDLVFFATDGPGPSHVGIYLGNNTMINATPPKIEFDAIRTPTGKKTFYGRNFYAARRVLPN
ncbi:MAG: C40 family peptidase [Peptococcaceae bacterium]|nr:C40 family peptidase [Peptococcaceae bacterium]